MKSILISILCCTFLLQTACTIHKLDIQQGNVVTEEMASQLKLGMNRKQVKFVLGTPMIVDPFRENRWDYVYLFHSGKDRREDKHYHLTLYFTDDQLSRIDSDIPSKN